MRVEAAPEELVEVTAPDAGALVRLAWHIGNRHLPAQLEPHRILIRADAVITHMLVGLGATVRPVLAPFTPEAGAYDTTTSAGHLHSAAHAHDHHHVDQAHTHDHDVDAHDYPHSRGHHE